MNLLLVSYVRKIFCTPLSKHRSAHPSTVPKEPDVNSHPFGRSTSGRNVQTVRVFEIWNIWKVWVSGILHVWKARNVWRVLCRMWSVWHVRKALKGWVCGEAGCFVEELRRRST